MSNQQAPGASRHRSLQKSSTASPSPYANPSAPSPPLLLLSAPVLCATASALNVEPLTLLPDSAFAAAAIAASANVTSCAARCTATATLPTGP